MAKLKINSSLYVDEAPLERIKTHRVPITVGDTSGWYLVLTGNISDAYTNHAFVLSLDELLSGGAGILYINIRKNNTVNRDACHCEWLTRYNLLNRNFRLKITNDGKYALYVYCISWESYQFKLLQSDALMTNEEDMFDFHAPTYDEPIVLPDTEDYMFPTMVEYLPLSGGTMFGDLDIPNDSVKLGNNGNILWKESGYGDKFAIKADFNGADDNNKLKIQGAVGGAGTDPNLIDLIKIAGKTGATTFVGSVASPNFIGATNGYTWDVTTENTNDTLLLVLNNSKIQHRTVNSVIDSCVKRDGNQTIHGQLTVEHLNAPDIYNGDTITSAPNLCITSTGKFRRTTNTSSKRYKKDIKLVEDDILNPERLYNLDIKQFKYKEEYQPNKNDSRYGKDLIGFIAEDVEKVFPIAVDYTEDENGNKIVDNWNEKYIVSPMLALIQKQHKEIEDLKIRIDEIEKKINK